VEQTSLETIELIDSIHELMGETKQEIKEKLPKIYSKDLIEILFMHPYTKIEFLIDGLELHRDTASKYLRELEKIDILKSIKIGRNKYFINKALFETLKKGI
jgi:Fic family protein